MIKAYLDHIHHLLPSKVKDNFSFGKINRERTDVAFALGLMAILMILIVPLPAWLLDFSLAISICFSIMILMTAVFVAKPLDFSSFPSILLVATMLRLGLNVASTRLILSHGHEGTNAAGAIIEAFGYFVMQGNFVIGFIVFSILVLVNFVVITKGSGRIAEVSARFSLDAMPGKQMAIDADLSAGIINEQEAKRRRKELQEESSFFGSMDGAAKFVRGDAIAGLLITFINVIGGIIIGVMQKDLTLSEASLSYTLLTVGDGLVAQVPALIVSTAAGMIVSKSGIEGSMDKAFFSQLSAHPNALGVGAFLLLIMGLIPAMPKIPFLTLATALGFLSYYSHQNQSISQQEEQKISEAQEHKEEVIPYAIPLDHIRLEMGYGLLNMIKDEEGNKLTNHIKALRKQMLEDMGFMVPAVRIQDNVQLGYNFYSVKIKELEVATGEIYPEKLMMMNPVGGPFNISGIETSEPTFGIKALWADPNLKTEGTALGYTVVDPHTVLTTHLTEVIKQHMSELITYNDVQKLLDEYSETHQKLIFELIPSQLNVSVLHRVLQYLLNEKVSIRDMGSILEALAEGVQQTRHVVWLSEHVRTKIARHICSKHLNKDGLLPVIALSHRWEEEFSNSLIGDGEYKQLALNPRLVQEFVKSVHAAIETSAATGELGVLVCAASLRPYIRNLLERTRPNTVLISQNEIHSKVKIKNLGIVE